MEVERDSQDSGETEGLGDPSSTEFEKTGDDARRQMLEEAFKALPPGRIQRYLDRAGGNPFEALALYNWNTQLSAAVFETIGHFEVSFRNRIDQALTERNQYEKRTSDWLDNKHKELSDRAVEAVEEARTRAMKIPGFKRGHIIAELNFSFWRRMLDERNERFFGNAILRQYPDHKAKSGPRNSLKRLVGIVEPIYSLRNRIAHHEPVTHLNLRARRDDMLRLIAAQNEDLSRWVEGNCRLNKLMPAPGDPTL